MRLFSRLPPVWRSIADIAVTLLLAGVIVWVARAYVMKPYTVPTGSMEPTLMIGDYVIADRVSLDFGDPSRFDIVVFHPPHCKNGLNDSQGACTTSNRKLRDGAASTTFIKRVIGLPGDKIWPTTGGHLMVKPANGPAFRLKEPWVMNHQELVGNTLHKMTIPAGHVPDARRQPGDLRRLPCVGLGAPRRHDRNRPRALLATEPHRPPVARE